MDNRLVMEQPQTPRDPRHLIVYYDEMGLQHSAVPLATSCPDGPDIWTKAIRDLVHVHAAAGVTALSKVVWSRFTHLLDPTLSSLMPPNDAHRP